MKPVIIDVRKTLKVKINGLTDRTLIIDIPDGISVPKLVKLRFNDKINTALYFPKQ